MDELKSIEEVDAAIADGRIKTLGDLVRAFPRAAFDLGVEDDLPPAKPPTSSLPTPSQP
jgi:hypothetical protein